MPRFPRKPALAAAMLICAASVHADVNAELDRILEANAASAAYARMCDEEPMSEQLKSNTMMLLAVNGLEPHNVQLGSAKFNDVMRREISAVRSPRNLDCAAKVSEARERLAFTQRLIASGRRDTPGN
jgi:hypothetical protein